jgi:hypothetical protein
LHRSGDPVGALAPPAAYWQSWPTVYGPVATALQWAAAKLGGASMVRIVFWIKFSSGLAFVATAAGLVRLAGGDRARQARVCLLWTVNPLMLYWLVGYGHVDVLLALLAVLLLIVIRSRYGSSVVGGVLAGLIVGVGMEIKTPFALVALGVAWAVRRSPRTLVAGLFGAVAVLVPCYLLPGVQNSAVLARRFTWGGNDLHFPTFILSRPTLFAAMVLLGGLALAGLLLWRMPPGNPALPAVRPAAALVIAYLATFPAIGPWYFAALFPLLALLPASRLDYLVIAWCLLLSESAITQHIHAVYTLSNASVLLVLATLIVMCLLRAWGAISPDGGTGMTTGDNNTAGVRSLSTRMRRNQRPATHPAATMNTTETGAISGRTADRGRHRIR